MEKLPFYSSSGGCSVRIVSALQIGQQVLLIDQFHQFGGAFYAHLLQNVADVGFQRAHFDEALFTDLLAGHALRQHHHDGAFRAGQLPQHPDDLVQAHFIPLQPPELLPHPLGDLLTDGRSSAVSHQNRLMDLLREAFLNR